MTTTTYAGLSTAAFRRLNRTADATVFNDCLELTEAEINRRLALQPVRPMHTVATSPVTTEYWAAPSDILDVDSMAIGDDPILPTTPQNIAAMFEEEETEDQPKFYAQVGTQFRFYPPPDTSYTVTLTYWSKIPALTSLAASNWLSVAHPDVYYHGVLAHLHQEYFDEENAEKQAGLFDGALQKVLDAYPHRPDRRPLRADPGLLRNERFNGITQG